MTLAELTTLIAENNTALETVEATLIVGDDISLVTVSEDGETTEENEDEDGETEATVSEDDEEDTEEEEEEDEDDE